VNTYNINEISGSSLFKAYFIINIQSINKLCLGGKIETAAAVVAHLLLFYKW
jgi:hypothetical protein